MKTLILIVVLSVLAALFFVSPEKGNGWDFARQTPELALNGHKASPQAVFVMPSGDILTTVHFEDTLSRAYVMSKGDSVVIGWFDFPKPYVHIASAAQQSNGNVWFADYATGDIMRVDIAKSLATNVAHIVEVRNVMTENLLSGIEWVTVEGEELLLLAEYRRSGTPLLHIMGEDTLRKLTITQRVQGIAYRNGSLYVISNRLTNGDNVGTLQQIDLLSFLSSKLQVGEWANYVVSTSLAPSNYPEDLSFDSSGKLYTATEGYNAVGDDSEYLSLWSIEVK